MRSVIKKPLNLIPKIDDIVFLAIFVATLLLGQRMVNIDGDLPRHILTGKSILLSGKLPYTEPFVYPYEAQQYTSHEWLTDIVFYLVFNTLGLEGLILLAAIILATAISMLQSSLSRTTGMYIPVLFLTLWGCAITSINWAVRPHIISMLFVVVFLVWVDKLARGKRIQLWYFPALMVLWSNLHGEFIAGILILVAYTGGATWDYLLTKEKREPDLIKKAWFLLAVTVPASLINPYGIRPWLTILKYINNDYLMSRMVEARPPDFSDPVFSILLGMLIFSIFILSIKKEHMPTWKGFLLAGFSLMALIATRNAHLYGLVAPFVLVPAIRSLSLKTKLSRHPNMSIALIEQRKSNIIWKVTVAFVLIFCVLFTSVGDNYQFSASFFPTKAIKWLEENPQQGNMFNDINWGGYIALHQWPEQRVFIDSMADISGEITHQYEQVLTTQDNYEDILESYNIKWIIISVNSNLASRLLTNADWKKVYVDEVAIIFQQSANR